VSEQESREQGRLRSPPLAPDVLNPAGVGRSLRHDVTNNAGPGSHANSDGAYARPMTAIVLCSLLALSLSTSQLDTPAPPQQRPGAACPHTPSTVLL
jgi:hypothetical protein